MSSMPPSTLHGPQKEVARGIVAIYKDYLGRGPSTVKTTIADDYVLTILEDVLTKAEISLVNAAEADTAREIRRKFQSAMRDDIVALIERVTDRKVAAFLSDHNVETDTAVELVTLEPDHEQAES
jgi:uncharacterized protein YbcI